MVVSKVSFGVLISTTESEKLSIVVGGMMMMMGWRWQLDPVDSSSSVQLSSASSSVQQHSVQC